jgi:hypothetical protein
LAFVVSDSICHGDGELIELGFALAASVREGLRLDGQDGGRQTWERDRDQDMLLTYSPGDEVTNHFDRL